MSRQAKRATIATLTLRVANLKDREVTDRSSDGSVLYSQEEEGDDEPRSQEHGNSVVELLWGLRVSSPDTVVRVEEGRVGQPETTVRGEG